MNPKALISLLLLVTLLGCNGDPGDKGPRFGKRPVSVGVPVYELAVHPLHNPARLVQAYQPLVDFLNGRLRGARLTLEASRDCAILIELDETREGGPILSGMETVRFLPAKDEDCDVARQFVASFERGRFDLWRSENDEDAV